MIRGVFDEYGLDVDIEYSGPPVTLSNQMPTMEDLGNGQGVAALSGYMIHQYTDTVRMKQRGQQCTLQLHFEH